MALLFLEYSASLAQHKDKESREAALAICLFQPYVSMSCYSYVLASSSFMIPLMQ
jgi:hypothetical protein